MQCIGGGTAPSGDEQTVIVYDPERDSYNTLPPYYYESGYFSMTVVDNQLVLVGGMNVEAERRTSKLGMWNEQSKAWTDSLPPMITACNSSSSHHHQPPVTVGSY